MEINKRSAAGELSLQVYCEYSEALSQDITAQLPATESTVHALGKAWEYLKRQSHPRTAKGAELSIRIVDASESQSLNASYRGKDKPTNVLSFESEIPEYVDSNHIGDLAICASVMMDEALAQGKTMNAHWSHLCVHGLLHLLGYDHIENEDATEMESLEIAILAELGIANPYLIGS